MLLAVRSTSCAAASENAIRELVGSAMSNPSEWVHGRDMASPRSCCYWPHGQGEASQRQSQLISPRVAHASRCVYRELSPSSPGPTRRIAELFDVQKQDFGQLGEQLVARKQSLAIESDPVNSRLPCLPPPEDPFC